MDKRIDLERLRGQFVRLAEDYMAKHDLSKKDLAEALGIQRTHLSALMSGGRKLSAYYVWLCLRGGVMKVKDIYDGKAETDREKDFWAMASEAENLSMLQRIAKLRRQGYDIDAILDGIEKGGGGS